MATSTGGIANAVASAPTAPKASASTRISLACSFTSGGIQVDGQAAVTWELLHEINIAESTDIVSLVEDAAIQDQMDERSTRLAREWDRH